MAAITQLVRVLGCGSKSHGFKSHYPPLNFFYINNIKIKNIEKDKNIIDCLENLNIKIPHYCYHQKLSVAGNCRMCLVELKNSPKPLVSCAMSISNKMEIFTDSPLVKKARENVLEFLLLNHPLDCPVCDQGGECDLQDQSMVFGGSKKRFYKFKHSVANKNLGPIVKTVMTRCIHCTRCVRFANEIAGVDDLGTFGRGANMEIGTYINKIFQSELSGNVIDICPVGALTAKPYAFIDRSWELKNIQTIDFSDSFGVNLQVSLKNNTTVTKILPGYNKNDSTNFWISDKTRFSFDGMFSNERISNILFYKNKNLVQFKTSWNLLFKEIIYILYFQDHLNKHLIRISKLTIIVSNMLPLEVLNSLILLEKRFFFIIVKKIGLSSKNYDLSSDFLVNNLTNNYKLNSSEFCLLLNVNTRYESSILNLKLRQRYLKGNFKLFSINSMIDYTFPVKQIGSNLKILNNIIEGNNYLCQEFLNSTNPIIITNSELFDRSDSFELEKLLMFFKQLNNIYNIGWSSFNLINTSINGAGVNNLGTIKPFSESDFKNSNGFYFIENNFNSTNFKKLVELKLLNYISTEKKIFTLNQTNFLMESILNYSNYNSNITIKLPTTVFFETSGTYYNTEGVFKKTIKIIPSLNQSKDNWQILRRLLNFLDKINYTNTNKSNKNLIFNKLNLTNFRNSINLLYYPVINLTLSFATNNIKKSNFFKVENKFKLVNNKIFSTKSNVWINDFYIGDNNNHTKFSKIMIECSKYLRLESSNFKYLN